MGTEDWVLKGTKLVKKKYLKAKVKSLEQSLLFQKYKVKARKKEKNKRKRKKFTKIIKKIQVQS